MWQNPDFLGQIENFKREEQVFEMFEGKMYIVEKKQKLWRLFIAHNLHYLDILLFKIRSRHYSLHLCIICTIQKIYFYIRSN